MSARAKSWLASIEPQRIVYAALALLVLSLIIAWLGIVNTLALSVFERTRELQEALRRLIERVGNLSSASRET